MPTAEITDVVNRQRAALTRREADTLARLVRAYRPIVTRFEKDVARLSDEIAALIANGAEPSLGMLARLTRASNLLSQSRAELGHFASDTLGPLIESEHHTVIE